MGLRIRMRRSIPLPGPFYLTATRSKQRKRVVHARPRVLSAEELLFMSDADLTIMAKMVTSGEIHYQRRTDLQLMLDRLGVELDRRMGDS